jgi:hypothetical protein
MAHQYPSSYQGKFQKVFEIAKLLFSTDEYLFILIDTVITQLKSTTHVRFWYTLSKAT